LEDLSFTRIISQGFKIGFKNLFSIIGAIILWILTLWIPYLNIGTTIGLVIGIIIEMSKGNVISPTMIFDKIYRKRMGEFFLVCSLMDLGILPGFILGLIPGIVLSTAWSFAPILVLDKEIDPSKAIAESNRLTYGKKWNIFGVRFFLFVLLILITFIVLKIFFKTTSPIAGVTLFIYIIVVIAIIISGIGAEAYIYKELTKDL
jgi:hypothetical protein